GRTYHLSLTVGLLYNKCMIVCADFDKTVFFRDDAALTAENLAAIKEWRSIDGNIFVLASNRSLGSLDRSEIFRR
nr:hypothetical protein [Candidatus Saccharibacteria bacterium]